MLLNVNCLLYVKRPEFLKRLYMVKKAWKFKIIYFYKREIETIVLDLLEFFDMILCVTLMKIRKPSHLHLLI